jgi:DNA N-6-adenine-methyltransferase (Dam).
MKRLKGLMTSNTPEWSTPDWLFMALDVEFQFDLDACATAENAKCKRYFTSNDDGLDQAWTGNVFCNPPYGRQIGRWVHKAYQSAMTGATCVLLLPARTDTRWWHRFCRHGEIRFLRGRLRFSNSKRDAPFPAAIVIFRGNPLAVASASASVNRTATVVKRSQK